MKNIFLFQNLMCCAADVLEGKGAVQVSITVTELLRFHSQRVTSPTKSPVNTKSNVSSPLPPTTSPV